MSSPKRRRSLGDDAPYASPDCPEACPEVGAVGWGLPLSPEEPRPRRGCGVGGRARPKGARVLFVVTSSTRARREPDASPTRARRELDASPTRARREPDALARGGTGAGEPPEPHHETRARRERLQGGAGRPPRAASGGTRTNDREPQARAGRRAESGEAANQRQPLPSATATREQGGATEGGEPGRPPTPESGEPAPGANHIKWRWDERGRK